ncbi:MAG: hypothetical protein HOV86_32610 [Thermoactinospora sp.]|nr:hypothetical protein [Thermoactinospora sp.]
MTRKWLLIIGAATVAAWFAAPPLGDELGYEFESWRIALLVLAGTTVYALVHTLPRPKEPAFRPRSSQTAVHSPAVADGVGLWEQRLRAARKDPERFDLIVRQRLHEITADRLEHRRGLRLEQAQDLLGEELHTLLTTPVTTVPSEAELARMITRIEEI